MNPDLSVALAVGSGGPTGGPFIRAALKALEERTGWVASSASHIVGTSAGAFVAAEFTEQAEASPAAVEALAALANGQTLRANPQTRLAAALRRGAGRIIALGTPTSKPMAAYDVPGAPFHPRASAVTVQLRTGRRVAHLLTEATDPEAVVRASAAIPAVNQPIEIDGVAHIDGAVHSANNVDLLDEDAAAVVVISPMIPASGGSIASRFHRAQLRDEIDPFLRKGIPVVVVMPSLEAHADRRNREPFATEGAAAITRL